MTATLPHFDAPFQFDVGGKPIVVQQDSPDDVAACVNNIVSCPKGGKLGDPDFGASVPLFGTFPPNWTSVISAIALHEPRANLDVITTTLSQLDPGEDDAQILAQALSQAEIS